MPATEVLAPLPAGTPRPGLARARFGTAYRVPGVVAAAARAVAPSPAISPADSLPASSPPGTVIDPPRSVRRDQPLRCLPVAPPAAAVSPARPAALCVAFASRSPPRRSVQRTCSTGALVRAHGGALLGGGVCTSGLPPRRRARQARTQPPCAGPMPIAPPICRRCCRRHQQGLRMGRGAAKRATAQRSQDRVHREPTHGRSLAPGDLRTPSPHSPTPIASCCIHG